MIRHDRRIRLCPRFLIVNLALIWGNSLISGADSGEMSGTIMAALMALLRVPEGYADLLHLLIRKLAHFTEFACFGALLTWRWGMAGEKGFHLWGLPLFCGMSAAMADETIQMFTPDRGPSLTDVWIDTAGVLAGITILLMGYRLVKKYKPNHKNLEETT